MEDTLNTIATNTIELFNIANNTPSGNERINRFCDIYKYVLSHNEVLQYVVTIRKIFLTKFFEFLPQRNEFVVFIPDIIKIYAVLPTPNAPEISQQLVNRFMDLDELSKITCVIKRPVLLSTHRIFENVSDIISNNIIYKNNKKMWINYLAVLCGYNIHENQN